MESRFHHSVLIGPNRQAGPGGWIPRDAAGADRTHLEKEGVGAGRSCCTRAGRPRASQCEAGEESNDVLGSSSALDRHSGCGYLHTSAGVGVWGRPKLPGQSAPAVHPPAVLRLETGSVNECGSPDRPKVGVGNAPSAKPSIDIKSSPLPSDEVRVSGHGDYLRDLLLVPGSEKEVRVFGLASWLGDRFRERVTRQLAHPLEVLRPATD